MFFKLQRNKIDGVVNCTLNLCRANSYADKVLNDGSIIKVRNNDDVDILATTTFSLSIPEEETRILRYINNAPEMKAAQQFLLDQLENQ